MTQTEAAVALRVSDAAVAIGGRDLVRGLSFVAKRGDRVALLGRSGAGKTTLLRSLAGVLPLAGGSVEVVSPEATASRMFVPQEPMLLWTLTVAENIEVFLRAARVDADRQARLVGELIELFGLGLLRGKLAGEVSGGEQQRLAMARVVALQPTVLMVDEPTARQDPDNRQVVIHALTAAAADGVLVVATHDPELAAACDVVVRLDGPDGTP